MITAFAGNGNFGSTGDSGPQQARRLSFMTLILTGSIINDMSRLDSSYEQLTLPPKLVTTIAERYFRLVAMVCNQRQIGLAAALTIWQCILSVIVKQPHS